MIYNITPSLAVDSESAPLSVEVALHMIIQGERAVVPSWAQASDVLEKLGMNHKDILRRFTFAQTGELISFD